jgi:hypothetical protein
VKKTLYPLLYTRTASGRTQNCSSNRAWGMEEGIPTSYATLPSDLHSFFTRSDPSVLFLPGLSLCLFPLTDVHFSLSYSPKMQLKPLNENVPGPPNNLLSD